MNLYPDSISFAEFADSLVVANPPEPVEELPAYMSGLSAERLFTGIGDSSVVVGILMLLVVLLMIGANGVRRTLNAYRGELWSLRQRPNVFDTETGLSIPVAVLLALTFIVFASTDIYIGCKGCVIFSLQDYFIVMGLVSAYYILKLAGYAMVGYAFAIPPGGIQWLTGYNAAMAFTGLILMVPTFAAMYTPFAAKWILPFALIMWIIGQIVFICKGFRIFYRDFGSIFYFFLYLCTLEIIPSFALAVAVC